jgi:hypothetical protein
LKVANSLSLAILIILPALPGHLDRFVGDFYTVGAVARAF